MATRHWMYRRTLEVVGPAASVIADNVDTMTPAIILVHLSIIPYASGTTLSLIDKSH